MKKFIFIFIGLIFSGNNNCQELKINDIVLDSVNSISEQKAFLEEIFFKDQRVRENEIQMNINCGYKSFDHLIAIKEMLRIDSINLINIKQFLIKFGYPNPDSVGEIACLTPLLAIHHCGYAEIQLEFFSILYNAWKIGYIDNNRYKLFLSRLLSRMGIQVDNLTLNELILECKKKIKYDFDNNK